MTKSLGQILQSPAPPRLKKSASEIEVEGFGIGTKFSYVLALIIAMVLTFLLQAISTCAAAPDDLIMAIELGGNGYALLPSQNAMLVAAEADGLSLQAGHSNTKMNLSAESAKRGKRVDVASAVREEQGPRFRKNVLSRQYFCDGICAGDINRDGHQDIVAGPFWYQGPEFKQAHAFYAAVALRPEKSPSDSMFSFVYDFNQDGWPDILVLGRVHLHAAHWYQNPGNSDSGWSKHVAFERVYGESPPWIDLDGDGRPQLVCHWEGCWGWIEPDWDSPHDPWSFHRISSVGEWKEFYHGTGVGDLNKDGRLDLVLNDGWFTQPAEAGRPWTWHPYQFSHDRGGAQIFVYDVDDDGDNDVISSLNAHGWGLAWFEQTLEKGKVAFQMHPIMGNREEVDRYGVAFSQPHALDFGDIDGDRLPDIVVGKRMWAHGPKGDIEPGAPPVLYWFQLVRKNGHAHFLPRLIDDRSGVGVQVTIADVNGDGADDVLTASKLGSFLFINNE